MRLAASKNFELVTRGFKLLIWISPIPVGYMFATLSDDKVLPDWLALLSAVLYLVLYLLIALFLFRVRGVSRSANPS